jgi:hypothetical protein
MKKLVLGAMSLLFLATAVISCKSGLSEEEITKKADEKMKESEAAIVEEAKAACDKIEAEKLDSIMKAKEEEKAKEKDSKKKPK